MTLIEDVRCHVLVDPDRDVTATSSAQDSMVVEIITADGVSGIGETDVNPDVARAHIEAPGSHSMALGLREMLLGEDPLDVERLWQKLYVGSAMTGRRGAGINAIGALDIALHDLRGKLTARPAWAALLDEGRSEPVRHAVRPYASLQPDVGDIDDYQEMLIADARRALELGFDAIKASLTFAGPYAHKGIRVSWERTTEVLTALRAAIGPDPLLMVDVQYGFADVEECVEVLATWREYDLYFVETPLWVDDVAGYREVVERQSIPIAMGEWLTTQHEFRQLIDERAIDVVQPDIGRVGGLTEARRVARAARAHDLITVPHLWKTGISIAAALHFAAATENCPLFEFLPAQTSDSAIRRELLTSDFEIRDGLIEVPQGPGLGVELDRGALARFASGVGAAV